MKKLLFIITFLYAQDPFSIIKEINSYNPKFDTFKTTQKKKIIKKLKQKNLPQEIKLSLDAIFNDVAFINGKAVKVGESIFGYKLIKIKNKKVYLVKNRYLKILTIKPKFIKVSK